MSEAARLINAADSPVVFLGMLARRPVGRRASASIVSDQSKLAIVGTFQAAGAVGAHLFDNFGRRVGQLARQPADRLHDPASLVITIGYDPGEY